jgi:3-oxoacyl-(acyl-carrier-protein) synthase III
VTWYQAKGATHSAGSAHSTGKGHAAVPIGIIGLGSYIPDRIVTNQEVAAWSGTTPEWIIKTTGIEERRYAADSQATSDLAVAAARAALSDADDSVKNGPGIIILATSTPDQPQPATAALVQRELGLPGVPAFDINAVCSGFLYAMTVAEAMLCRRTGGSTALVIGADKYSAIMNPRDRRTVSLFGDAAGAVVLGEVPDGYGIHASELVVDGQYSDFIQVPAGGTRYPADEAARAAGAHLFAMNGFTVREYVLGILPKVVTAVLDRAELKIDQIDRFVFHQANTRLLLACAAELGISPDRVAMTAPRLGNTATASIPVTLAADRTQRPLERGERLVFAAVGGGMSTGAMALTWY